MQSNDITFCIGPAGTGKSYVSVYYALKQLAEKGNGVDGIILCRPMTYLDNESIGYLPGNLEEKVDPFMWAYWGIIEKILGKARMKPLVETDLIQVVPVAFLRGLTLDNKIILYDEAQNSTASAMKSFLTRLGEQSKMVIMGDLDQTDRKGVTGLEDAIKRLWEVPKVGFSGFSTEDIVRNGMIKNILKSYRDTPDLEAIPEF